MKEEPQNIPPELKQTVGFIKEVADGRFASTRQLITQEGTELVIQLFGSEDSSSGMKKLFEVTDTAANKTLNSNVAKVSLKLADGSDKQNMVEIRLNTENPQAKNFGQLVLDMDTMCRIREAVDDVCSRHERVVQNVTQNTTQARLSAEKMAGRVSVSAYAGRSAV